KAGRRQPLLLSSLTAQIGHTMGHSGMAALIKAVLELERGQVPATFGLSQPITLPDDARESVCVPTRPEKVYAGTESGHGLAAISNTDAHGAAYHIILEGGTRLPTVPDTAESTSQPAAGTGVARRAERPFAPRPALGAASETPTHSGQPVGAAASKPPKLVRLSLVVSDSDDLPAKLRSAAELIGNGKPRSLLERQGIFCAVEGDRPAKVAFLFPGQGSQYVGMLRELVETIPAAAAKRNEIDTVLRGLGLPTYEQLAWHEGKRLGTDVLETQLAVLAADMILYAVLADMGVRPDVVAGHSYGEFAALVACGAMRLEEAIRATCARAEATRSAGRDLGRLLSVMASREAVEQHIQRSLVPIWIANENGAEQVVVGGPSEAIGEFQQRLEKEGIRTWPLSVPCAYHTPLLAPAQQPFAEVLSSLDVRSPQIAFVSSVTNEPTSEPFDIRRNLVAQLTTPVRYIDLIHRLVKDGVTVFIEAGPNDVLTRITRRILGEEDVSVVASDHPKVGAKEQLACVRAVLACRAAGGTTATPSGLAASAEGREDGHVASLDRSDGQVARPNILHFDATQRRKEAMRRAAQSAQRPPVAPRPADRFSAPAAAACGGGVRSGCCGSMGCGAGEVRDARFHHRADRVSAGDDRVRSRPGGRSRHRQHQESSVDRRVGRAV
ncbi:MAG: acyltransferase domain-containing protein, partial [Planctomycetes bacterium]|nr:acyltransferase domain-containing protein [Planctomycetota bacterium]